MLIKNTVQILFGSETKAMPEVIPLGGIQIGNYRITYVQCTVMVVVTVLCILLSIFLNKTKQGVILRAVSQDRKAAAMVGIDVSGATLMGNVLGCGIGGVAGMLYALYYGSLSASMGGMATMKAFSSSVLGGLVDIQASAIGGLLIGISENYGIALFSSSLRDMIAFVFLIIVLIFLPKGLRIKIGRLNSKMKEKLAIHPRLFPQKQPQTDTAFLLLARQFFCPLWWITAMCWVSAQRFFCICCWQARSTSSTATAVSLLSVMPAFCAWARTRQPS